MANQKPNRPAIKYDVRNGTSRSNPILVLWVYLDMGLGYREWLPLAKVSR